MNEVIRGEEDERLLSEVHAMEDRIDITSMEIEDLEEKCAALAGEIRSLQSRLDRCEQFKDAADVRHEIPSDVEIRKPEPVKAIEQKDSPAEESSSSSKPKKRRRKRKMSVLDFQPGENEEPDSPENLAWEPVSGENILDPYGKTEKEDRRVPRQDRKEKKRRVKLEKRARKEKKKADLGKVYCPVCGFYVGEDLYCKQCGAKVK